jgi:hypothetical protein
MRSAPVLLRWRSCCSLGCRSPCCRTPVVPDPWRDHDGFRASGGACRQSEPDLSVRPEAQNRLTRRLHDLLLDRFGGRLGSLHADL